MPVDFPDLSDLSENATIADFVALPNSSYPFFWLWILAGIWLILTFTLYFKQREKENRGFFLSSMAISGFAILILAVFGSLFGIITTNILTYIIVFVIIIIAIWMFNEK